MKRLNNQGYMLIEIILASALAMGVAYFITDLTINLKNKNDDLLVKTLVSADQAIIYNTIMKDIYSDVDSFRCSDIQISGNTFTYNGFTNVVSQYADVKYDSSKDCSVSSDNIKINIGLKVKQLTEDNFDVNIDYTK